jgi:ankyrin repeat protein
MTPLHYAAAKSTTSAIAVTLLELGADPRVRTSAGSTAWDLIQHNQKLRNTPAFRRLSEIRF